MSHLTHRSRVGGGLDPPLENHQAIESLSYTGLDPLENHKAIPNQHSMLGHQMVFCWLDDSGVWILSPLINNKKRQSLTLSKKKSGSVHVSADKEGLIFHVNSSHTHVLGIFSSIFKGYFIYSCLQHLSKLIMIVLPIQANIQPGATNYPQAKHHSNCILLAGRKWPSSICLLGYVEKHGFYFLWTICRSWPKECSPFTTSLITTWLWIKQSCCSSYFFYYGILQRNNRKMTMNGHFPIIPL